MPSEYSDNQLNLSQRLQQQRILELQVTQQRYAEMMAQNQNRFSEMRDRFLATTMPYGGTPMASEMGFFGRQISQMPGGAARQSLLGAIIDMNAASLSGSLLFRRAGYQFGTSQRVVQERAAQQVGVFGNQIGNVAFDALMPTFLQQAMGRVGLGNIQEDSLGLMDTFGGIRGSLNGSDTVNRRGITGGRAAREYEMFVKAMNTVSGGRMSDEDMRMAGRTAYMSLDDRQISQAAVGGNGSLARLLEQQVRKLDEIAKNTGMSSTQLAGLVEENKSLGNDINSIVTASRTVENFGPSSGASRFRQLKTALQLTAQGRQLNLADADVFSANQMSRIGDLVRGFTDGTISRSELFRFGGADAFEAATRVRTQQIEQGANYATRNARSLGVLGNQSTDIQRTRGFIGTQQAIAGAYLRDPYAGVVAEFTPQTIQDLGADSAESAYFASVNTVALYPGIKDSQTRDALVMQQYAKRMGVSPLEARQQVNRIKGEQSEITDAVRAYAAKKGSGVSVDTYLSRAMRAVPGLRSLGASITQILKEKPAYFEMILEDSLSPAHVKSFVLGAAGDNAVDTALEKFDELYLPIDSKRAKGSEWINKVTGLDGLFHEYNAVGASALKADGQDANMTHFANYLATATDKKGKKLFDLDIRTLSNEMWEQDMMDGERDFDSVEQIEMMVNNPKKYNAFKSFSKNRDGLHYMQRYLSSIFTSQTLINADKAADSTGSYDKPFWIRMKE